MKSKVLQGITTQSSTEASPTTRRRGRRVGAVGVALAAAALALGTMFGSTAEASWKESPDQLVGAKLTGAAAACSDRLALLPRMAGPAPSGPGLVTLGEQRGSTSSVLLADGHMAGICIGTAHARFDGLERLKPISADVPLQVDEAQAGQTGGPGATRFAFGRVNAQVTTVKVVTTDGLTVTASRSGGYFLAWWPSGADAASVTAYDGAGHVVAVSHPQPASGHLAPTHR